VEGSAARQLSLLHGRPYLPRSGYAHRTRESVPDAGDATVDFVPLAFECDHGPVFLFCKLRQGRVPPPDAFY
jgi:hypothetical protein